MFRKWGRNEVWKVLKKKTKRKAYNAQKKDRILSGSVIKFHECVHAFVNNDKAKEWSPRQ